MQRAVVVRAVDHRRDTVAVVVIVVLVGLAVAVGVGCRALENVRDAVAVRVRRVALDFVIDAIAVCIKAVFWPVSGQRHTHRSIGDRVVR